MPKTLLQLIDGLQRLRQHHGVRAATLVPDLALIGLVNDMIDAAETALDLLEGERPYRAYAMERVAFEAAQRLLVLATSDEYLNLGTRAWLYYQGKDEAIRQREGADDSLEAQIVRIWAARFPDAEEVVSREREVLRKLKGPDNFLGRKLAEAVDHAYATLTKFYGSEMPSDLAEINRRVYRVLCRDTHACVRFEPSTIRIDSEGFVEVAERPRERSEIEKGVRSGLTSSLKEATSALEYRLSQRETEHLAQLKVRIGEIGQPKLASSFAPDLGIYLVEHGCGAKALTFLAVPLHIFAKLPDGTLRLSVELPVGGDTLFASFDFRGTVRDHLMQHLRGIFPDMADEAFGGSLSGRIELPSPVTATLTALFGNFEETESQAYIPLVVVEVDTAREETAVKGVGADSAERL
jgi:hypothetical protein